MARKREFATSVNSMARAMAGHILQRMGMEEPEFRAEVARYSNLDGYSILEMARECLRDAGVSFSSFRDEREMIGRALTTSDFPKVLGDVANKVLDETYKIAPGTFEIWTGRKAAPNFRPFSISRISPPSDLPEIGESAEYTQLEMKEGEETARLRTYGGIFGISRRVLVNDDLGVFQDVGRALGQTARSTQNRKVYSRLLANPTLSDGTAMFHGDRGNLLSGAGTALSRDSLSLAVKIMRLMTDDSGNPLMVEPKYLLVPPSLEITAYELCFSDSMPGQSNSAVPNMFKKLGIVPVVEPLLESPTVTGYSATAWYLVPDPSLHPAMVTVTLGSEGNLAPYTDSAVNFNNDQIEHKVRIDFDAAAISARAVKSLGQ